MRFRFLIYAIFILPMMHNFPVVAGPATQPGTTQPAPLWGETANGLQLSVSSSKSVYAPGETIELLIGIRNVTKNPILIEKTLEIDYYYKPIVFLPDDKIEKPTPAPLTLQGQVWIRESGGAFQIWDEELQPGQAIYDHWNDVQRMYDMTLDGKYPVFVVRKFLRGKDEDNKEQLRSNTIIVTIDTSVETVPPADNTGPQGDSETGK